MEINISLIKTKNDKNENVKNYQKQIILRFVVVSYKSLV